MSGGWTPEIRARHGKASAAAAARARRETPVPNEGPKQCNSCTKWKRYNVLEPSLGEFATNKRTLTNGEVILYPSSQCRECLAAKTLARRKRKRQQLGEEEWKQQQRAYKADYGRRNREKIRRYSREYGRLQRERAGIQVHGSWLKYRKQKDPTLDPAPFLEWLDEWLAATGQTEADVIRVVDQLTGQHGGAAERALWRWRSGEGRAALGALDAFFVAMGMSDQFACLYPDD